MTTAVIDARPSSAAVFARALGNIFLGFALGLLVYYATTDVASRADVRVADRALARVGIARGTTPPVKVEGPKIDWTGWILQDRAYWTQLAEGDVFGRLVIKEIDLDTPVVKGTSRADLQHGAGWIEWTSLPGPQGTAGIAGHRTTWGHPFRHIDKLKAGDTLVLYSPYRRYTYRVVELKAVRPWETEVMRSGTEPKLVLSACHPPFSAAYRLTCTARLVEVKRLKNPVNP